MSIIEKNEITARNILILTSNLNVGLLFNLDSLLFLAFKYLIRITEYRLDRIGLGISNDFKKLPMWKIFWNFLFKNTNTEICTSKECYCFSHRQVWFFFLLVNNTPLFDGAFFFFSLKLTKKLTKKLVAASATTTIRVFASFRLVVFSWIDYNWSCNRWSFW